jgi:septum formation protein
VFLASKSPQRKALLKNLGIDFDIIPPDYHEVDPPGATPAELVERHSRGKAMSVLPSLVPINPERPVMGVDTLVVIDGEATGKPGGVDEARSVLRRLSGRTHEVVSGVALIWAAPKLASKSRQGKLVNTNYVIRPLTEFNNKGQNSNSLWLGAGYSITTVKFSEVSDEELEAYLVTGEWRGRAGAYAIQERASAFVEEIHGDYTNVVGLPVPLLVAMLREAGLWPPGSWDH